MESVMETSALPLREQGNNGCGENGVLIPDPPRYDSTGTNWRKHRLATMVEGGEPDSPLLA
jgi:hypothetical protein